jgi:hypothetical protein
VHASCRVARCWCCHDAGEIFVWETLKPHRGPNLITSPRVVLPAAVGSRRQSAWLLIRELCIAHWTSPPQPIRARPPNARLPLRSSGGHPLSRACNCMLARHVSPSGELQAPGGRPGSSVQCRPTWLLSARRNLLPSIPQNKDGIERGSCRRLRPSSRVGPRNM